MEGGAMVVNVHASRRAQVQLSSARKGMVFAIVMAGLVSQGLIFSLPSPVMPLMAAAFGAARGPLLAQMLFTLPSLGLMVVGLISGWLLDLAGLRRTLAASLIVYGGM